jgi:ACS family tartrate transporter-like MFS transporter
MASAAGGALESGLRKARWRLLPLLSVCYLVAYMDRTNISFAAETMNHDLHFTPRMYGLGAGLFFLSYALCEVPSNALMLRVGARRWLARIMLTWGLLAAGVMFVKTPPQFYGARLLLGCAEAGYFPGAIYYLSQWFPRTMRAQAISLFYVALPVSTTVMGALAGALLRLNGRMGLHGWQWMFLVEAAPAVVLGFVLWFALPDSVAKAGWLSGAEKAAIGVALAADELGAVHGADGLMEVLRSAKAWALGVAYFFELGVSYALAFSLPILFKQMTGWDAGHVGYGIAGIGVAGGLSMVGMAWISDRSGRGRRIILVGYMLMAVGVLMAGGHLSGWVAVAGLVVTLLSFYAIQGPMLSVMTTIFPGRQAAIAIAFANMLAIMGGFAGPYWMGWMREATGSYAWGVGLLCVPCLMAGGLMMWVTRPELEMVVEAAMGVV